MPVGDRENVAGVPLDEYQRNRGADPVKGPDAAKVLHLKHPKIQTGAVQTKPPEPGTVLGGAEGGLPQDKTEVSTGDEKAVQRGAGEQGGHILLGKTEPGAFHLQQAVFPPEMLGPGPIPGGQVLPVHPWGISHDYICLLMEERPDTVQQNTGQKTPPIRGQRGEQTACFRHGKKFLRIGVHFHCLTAEGQGNITYQTTAGVDHQCIPPEDGDIQSVIAVNGKKQTRFRQWLAGHDGQIIDLRR